jgi:hypothetical protein
MVRKKEFARQPRLSYLEGMDLHLNNPDLQAKRNRWVTETGRAPDELIEDAIAGYFDELARTREMLNSRYDDLKSGRVKAIDGEQFFENLRRREANCSRSTQNDRRAGLALHPLAAQDITEFGNTSRQTISLQPERSERKFNLPSAPWFPPLPRP